jgi:pSer/pThr/pTyr-binding forkhead associated (FHA) protein
MQAQVPLLVVQEGQLLGHEWSLDRDMMTLGRGEECDMTVPERQVSRVHLRIQRDASGYLVEDLDSKNGTFVNGRQVQPGTPVRLQDGDEITVALCVRLLFVGAEATVPLAGREAVPVTASGLSATGSCSHRSAWRSTD